jgi:hypothetical protein
MLIEHCFGQFAQDHLEHLIIAIRRYWYSNNYGLDKYLPLRSYIHPWVPYVCYDSREADKVTWPIQVDPVDIPEIKWLIKQSTRRWILPRMKKAEQGQTRLAQLPMDIYSRILEFLEVAEMKSCISAVGCSAPAYHWRQRLGGLIF